MNLHLSMKHDVSLNTNDKTNKILKYLQKYNTNNGNNSLCASSHELVRDILLWFCRDLTPFDHVERCGFRDFFAKNLPGITLPSPDTLGGTALDDVYQAVRTAVKEKLKPVNAFCVMFDGWTDRYKARPYLGVRISFISDWQYSVLTIGCHVIPSHTSRDIADHVQLLLQTYFPDLKKVLMTTCHDGAANMLKTSKLLKVEYMQHCAAHSLHLLLTTDSMNKLEDVVEILSKCRSIVTTLHFKGLLVEDEIASTNDHLLIADLQSKLAKINYLLDADDQILPTLPEDSEMKKNDGSSEHLHNSLKRACPTCWNSTLYMLESILQLHREVDNALEHSGQKELCLHTDEIDFLKELVAFLTPFKEFTDLFSSTIPNLAMIPLMKRRIKQICATKVIDDPKLTKIKKEVLAKVDCRFPDSEQIKLHQLLDPDTKDLIPRAEATVILEQAINKAVERGLIVISASGNDGVSSQSHSSVNVQGRDDDEDQEEEQQAKKRRLRYELLNELRTEVQPSYLPQTAVEVTSYLTSRIVANDDILTYWKNNSKAGVFPLMTQLAMLHLSASASSVPVECTFSTCGLIANSKRSSLSADKLHRISYIHDNFETVMM